MNIKEKINNILNYYKENENCDPNVYEFITLCDEVALYFNREAPNYGIYPHNGITEQEARKMYPVPCEVLDNFRTLYLEFEDKLLNSDLDITESSPLYILCEQAILSSVQYFRSGDEELDARVGAVALYIAQGKRDVRNGKIDSFTYNNAEELYKINDDNRLAKIKGNPRTRLIEEINKKRIVLIALTFGIMQALMPLIGYFLVELIGFIVDENAGDSAGNIMSIVVSWIAFALLIFIGSKMIYEAIRGLRSQNVEQKHDRTFNIKEQAKYIRTVVIDSDRNVREYI